ncbi:MAG TPA: cobyrinic acid a,c-diamide synthase, partial [Rhodospirillales bacterium]|nr:cobyrinic acid a,c-diamide synthase [Rhodospirillales bacterium]
MAHVLISAARKSSGKTTLSIGLAAALSRRGKTVQAFKKGPDYIDPMWLSRGTGRACFNLDFYTMSEAEICATF